MATISDINYQIEQLQQQYDDYIADNDIITFTNDDEKQYVTSNTLLYNVKKATQTAIQQLEQEKNDSLIEYEYVLKEDSTIYNVCFDTYGIVDETNMDLLITANDLNAFNRTDIDPNDPIYKKGMKFLYYK